MLSQTQAQAGEELSGTAQAQLRVVAMAQMAWPLREYPSKPL
jgi:hypothetical protein